MTSTEDPGTHLDSWWAVEIAFFTKPRIENNIMIADYIICKRAVKKKHFPLGLDGISNSAQGDKDHEDSEGGSFKAKAL